ncbi:hypothetical protein ACLOJK_023637 [Asimina triloba]
MELKRNTRAAGGDADELDIIKAAAWAWYLHGSGSERKISREFYISRRSRAVGPSRYKLEAMKDAGGSGELRPEPCLNVKEIPLANSHEVDRISVQLGSVLGSTGSPYDHRSRSPSSTTMVADDAARRRKVRKLNGFWLRHAIAVCSSRRDMVETRRRS